MNSKIDNAFQFSRTVLGLHSARQELIASNIANADTPNYKAKDIDFAKALQGAISGNTTQLQMAGTAPQHLSGNSGKAVMGVPVMYRTVVQPSADGNTVDMDVERAQFADNSLRYQASVNFADGRVKSILAAIQG
ncbi:flagellar basal body rod protein FlgB [Candidatus Nitrotoga sp. M5]|uniref:flagellar basal body rod protein FlgB n=1 Tax=Candidatus Nitrotoga sp. M5 TaxID=2890409 RepID=UPI001EF6F054|nr:flagellar basal body rod protein FlgB [Candidatus Nitrotoga sp. M5]CAH1387736.1 flagellar basal-body rod protein FlgB [Candidatus Nitrotoga sp. M5]